MTPQTHTPQSESHNYQEGFPKYFRKDGTCVRVDSPTQLKVIKLPPDTTMAERYSSTYPSKERLNETLSGMEPTTAEIFKNFYFTFLQHVTKERMEMIEKSIKDIPVKAQDFAPQSTKP